MGVLAKFINRGFSNIHAAAYLLAFGSILSQVLAIIRDRMFAHSFGASEILDTYYIAFRIPDIVYVVIASLVSLAVLVPLLAREEQKGKEHVNYVLSNLLSFFGLLTAVIFSLAVVFLPSILGLLFPQVLQSDLSADFIALSRLLLFQPILLGLSSFFLSVNQLRHRFIAYALSPIFYNLGIIFGVLFFYEGFGLMGLGYGVVLGAFAHLGVQFLSAHYQSDLKIRLTLALDFKLIGSVLGHSIPRTLTIGATQIILLVLVVVGATMNVGSVSVFNFAYNLQSVPLSLIGVSYSVAAFPVLSRLYAEHKNAAFARRINQTIRHIVLWSALATTLFIVLRAHIVRVLYGTGMFDWSDTRLTAAILAIFMLSVMSQSISMLLIRSFYAAEKTWQPLIAGVVAASITSLTVLGLRFVYAEYEIVRLFFEALLRLEGVEYTEVIILPMAFSLGAIIHSFILWYWFRRVIKKTKSFDIEGISESIFRSLGMAIIAGYSAHLTLRIIAEGVDQQSFIGILIQGFLAGAVALVVAMIFARLLKIKEWDEVMLAIRKRIR